MSLRAAKMDAWRPICSLRTGLSRGRAAQLIACCSMLLSASMPSVAKKTLLRSGLGSQHCIVRSVRVGLVRHNLRVAVVDPLEIGGADLRGGVFRHMCGSLAFAIADDSRPRRRSCHHDLIHICPAEALHAEQCFHASVGVAGKCGAGFVVGHEVAGGDETDAVFIDRIHQDVFDRRHLRSVERLRRTGR